MHSYIEVTKGKYVGLEGIVTEFDEEMKEARIELKINHKIVSIDPKYLKLFRKSKKI